MGEFEDIYLFWTNILEGSDVFSSHPGCNDVQYLLGLKSCSPNRLYHFGVKGIIDSGSFTWLYIKIENRVGVYCGWGPILLWTLLLYLQDKLYFCITKSTSNNISLSWDNYSIRNKFILITDTGMNTLGILLIDYLMLLFLVWISYPRNWLLSIRHNVL